MTLIPQDTIEDVRLQTDIVSLIGEYIRLEKKGKNYVGLCLFHQDSDPSFTVSPEKQIFYCFGCQAGGNVFKFLMLAENLTFVESVRRLANRAGIYFPDIADPGEKRKAAMEERAWQVNAEARTFYNDYLWNAPEAAEARDYLAKRGLSGDVANKFMIGYAPSGWDKLVRFMGVKGCHPDELVEIGLAARADRGRVYDLFRGRILFPICSHQGKVVGFGGRVMDKSLPKYINTPETFFFNKSRILYGLDLARQAVKQDNHAVIMEGYMDVITAHQFGICNAVASMGTSLTPEQGKVLMRYTRDVYISYDADAAGVSAASRGLDTLQQFGCRLKVISMPRGADPDEFIRKSGAAGWRKLVEGAETLLEYKLRLAQAAKREASDVLNEIMPNLVEIKSEIEAEESIKTVAARLNLSWEAVKGEIRRYREKQRKKQAKPDKTVKRDNNIIEGKKINDAVTRAEIGLVKVLLNEPGMSGRISQALGDDFMEDRDCSSLYRTLTGALNKGSLDPASLLGLVDEQSAALLSRLMVEKKDADDTDRIVADYISVINKNKSARMRQRFLADLAQAEKEGDQQLVQEILEKIQKLR